MESIITIVVTYSRTIPTYFNSFLVYMLNYTSGTAFFDLHFSKKFLYNRSFVTRLYNNNYYHMYYSFNTLRHSIFNFFSVFKYSLAPLGKIHPITFWINPSVFRIKPLPIYRFHFLRINFSKFPFLTRYNSLLNEITFFIEDRRFFMIPFF